MYIITFEVAGGGAFPLDMLRYDHCFPNSTGDAFALAEDRHTGTPVKLIAYSNSNDWEPTKDRWASFGWTVSNVEGRKF